MKPIKLPAALILLSVLISPQLLAQEQPGLWASLKSAVASLFESGKQKGEAFSDDVERTSEEAWVETEAASKAAWSVTKETGTEAWAQTKQSSSEALQAGKDAGSELKKSSKKLLEDLADKL